MDFFKLCLGWEDASITRAVGVAGVYDHELAIHADGGSLNQRNAVANAGCVDGLARFVVVRAVQHHVGKGNFTLQAFTTEPQPGLKEKCQPLFTSPAPAPNALDAEIVKDAERYRWLAAKCRSTSEHWGGRWSIVVDGPAPATSNSEDDFDAAIDAAIAAQSAQGGV